MPVLDIDGPANTNLATTAETVVATVTGINTRSGGGQVILQGNAQITTGTGVTGVQLRIRRGTAVAGAQVGGTMQLVASASSAWEDGIQVQDNIGEVAGQSYVLTAQQVGATGNGQCTNCNLRAEF